MSGQPYHLPGARRAAMLNRNLPIHVGNVIRNAVVFGRAGRGGVSVNPEPLPATVARLFALLGERQIDYLLVGGIAMLQYVAGRNTEVIDLIISSESLERLPEITITDRNESFARGHFDGLQIDVLLAQNPLFDHVRRLHGAKRRFAEQDIPCATVEGLLLLKLYALPSLYRQGDFARTNLYEADVAALLHDYGTPTEPIVAELGRHLNRTDLQAVRAIVVEIRARIERFRRGVNG